MLKYDNHSKLNNPRKGGGGIWSFNEHDNLHSFEEGNYVLDLDL